MSSPLTNRFSSAILATLLLLAGAAPAAGATSLNERRAPSPSEKTSATYAAAEKTVEEPASLVASGPGLVAVDETVTFVLGSTSRGTGDHGVQMHHGSPTGYISNEDGCDINCIISALFYPTADPTVFELRVETTVPTEIVVNTNAPFAEESIGFSTYTELLVTGFTPGITAFVAVGATDQQGDSWTVSGPFDVPAAPDVRVRLELVTIGNDGDSDSSGDLTFSWDGGSVGEIHLNDGDILAFPASATWVIPELVGLFSSPTVRAVEGDPNDGDKCSAHDGYMFDQALWGVISCHDDAWNTAVGALHGVAEIPEMARCSEFGLTGAKANLACEQLSTEVVGGEIPDFEVLVSYEIL